MMMDVTEETPVDPGVLSALPWGDLTPPAILAMFFVFMMLGLLVPRWFYTKIEKERDYWREAHKESEGVRVTTVKQLSILAEALDKLADKKDLGITLIESVKADEEQQT